MAPRDIRTTELTLTRTIAAKPAAIFDRWLDIKKPGSPWFGIKKAILNPAVEKPDREEFIQRLIAFTAAGISAGQPPAPSTSNPILS